MSASGWGLLDEKEEAELHKMRLLNVEEKPFKRITKRLQSLSTLAANATRQEPSPPPESNGNGEHEPAATASGSLSQLKEDLTLDFAAFDSSIARLQFLLTANDRERERYASDRGRILSNSQAVRDSTAELRTKLDEARATLEQRKKFDELAEKITSNRSLRPRAEQVANLQKLEEECKQLEAESEEYTRTWKARGEQFDRIMEESMKLRRQIRDEKEEVERREGMDDNDGAVGDVDGAVSGGHTPRPGFGSGNNTPRPDSGAVATTAKSGLSEETPRPPSTTGGQTPARDGETPAAEGQELKPKPETVGSANGSAVVSREGTPRLGIETKLPDASKEDVEMGDGEQPGSSPLTPVPNDLSPVTAGNTSPKIVVGNGEDDKMDET